MFDKYGRVEGYGQMAPGRDIPPYEEPGQNGRPRKQQVINSAIAGGIEPPQSVFQGAVETLGAETPGPKPQQMQQAKAGGSRVGATIGAQMRSTPRMSGGLMGGIAGAATGMAGMAPAMGLNAGTAGPMMGQTQAPGGIAPQPEPGQVPQAPTAPALRGQEAINALQQQGLGQYGDRLRGYNTDNLQAGAGRATPKELIGRVLSGYDPTKGLTQEMIDKLNTLDMGDFYIDDATHNDKLGVRNARNNEGWGRENFGQNGLWDVIEAYDPGKGGNWALQDLLGSGNAAQRAAYQRGGTPPQLMDAIVGNTPQVAAENDPDYSQRLLQQIMAALQGDPQMAQLAKVYGKQ